MDIGTTDCKVSIANDILLQFDVGFDAFDYDFRKRPFHAGYRGLAALEAARLVSVVRHRGRNPIVTILDGPEIRRD